MTPYFKEIPKADNKTLLTTNEEILSTLSRLTGKKISRGYAPLVGAYMEIDGKRFSEKDPKHTNLVFAYEWSESGELICIYIGSDIHGPLMSWRIDGWRNLYGHGNHDKNGACGVNWSSSGRRVYETMSEALDDRDYKVNGVTMHRSRLIEGPGLIESLQQVAEGELK